MATLTPTLTLTSTDATSDALSITVTDSLTTANPQTNIARKSILHTGPTNILTTADSAITYVYLKNLDSTNIITVKIDDATAFLDLSPGEFAFMPLKGAVGLECQANSATCVLEYGYWAKG
tara:strand:- start:1111 stop:1473 length:363 start_codon:yes stop_codon:yes gene_type:complete